MKKLIAIILAVLCLLALTACGGGGQPPVNDPNAELPDVVIKTPYCDLVVTGEFAENVKDVVSAKNPYTISFRMKSDDTELFSIVFGGEGEDLLGTLISEKENTVIYAAFNDFDSEDENYETYCMYQEGFNTIIEHLISDNDFVANEIIEWEDTGTFNIKTPVVTMKYPSKWKDKVTIEVVEDSVKFSCNGEKLFDLYFVECDGYLLGMYKDTPIYIVDYSLDKAKYSEEQYLELCAMQEDVNVILYALMEDSSFVLS